MVLEGKLHKKFDAQDVSQSFKKREFILLTEENPLYPQYPKFELTQDRCGLIDALNIGDKIEVTFNIRGREHTNNEGEVKYFTTLDAWRVQAIQGATQAVSSGGSLPGEDEFPFG